MMKIMEEENILLRDNITTDEVGWDGMGWDEMGWDGIYCGYSVADDDKLHWVTIEKQ